MSRTTTPPQPYPSPFYHSVSFRPPFFSLSSLPFPPSLCSTALLTSAGRKPSVLRSATNRRRRIKKHHSAINSTACLQLECDQMGIESRERVIGSMKGEGPGHCPGTLGPWELAPMRDFVLLDCAALISHQNVHSSCSGAGLHYYLFLFSARKHFRGADNDRSSPFYSSIAFL